MQMDHIERGANADVGVEHGDGRERSGIKSSTIDVVHRKALVLAYPAGCQQCAWRFA